MASLKCKMCGGELQIVEGSTVCECEYCGSRQTVPTADNEKKMNLFSRANRLRFNCEFDKAAGIYESIISEFPEEAEAYWGLILCKYGIEYVDDPATGRKIPTCHRSSFDSVLEDENYELATEYADLLAKRVYRDEARQIEELRKGIIEVSSKEEPYDIFICYKETDENGERTLDSVIAQDIYKELTGEGYRVFFSRITLEDKLGQEYEPYIFAALHSAKVMLAVGTMYEYYDAVWVKNEWSRFLQLIANGEKKTLIPCYKNLDAYDMPKEFARLQAQNLGKVGAMQDLLRGIEKILGKKKQQSAGNAGVSASAGAGQTAQAGQNAAVQSVDAGRSILSAQNQSLLDRGFMAIEDGEWDKANGFFENVLNNDSKCGKAYWGKTLCAFEVKNEKQLAEKLIKQIEEAATSKKVKVPDSAIAQVARDVDDDGMLNYFTDEELVGMMKVIWEHNVKCTVALYEEDNYLEYFNDQIKMLSPEYIRQLINNKDYNHALQFADDEVRKITETICIVVKNAISGHTHRNEYQVEKMQDMQEEIQKRLSEAKPEYHRLKAELEKEKKKAELQAEADYKKAVADHEAAYRQALENWKRAKEDFEQNADAVKKKKKELQEKIDQLWAKFSNVKGIFASRKREEIEESIDILKDQLNGIKVPQDPGDKPTKGKAPERDEFIAELPEKEKYIKEIITMALYPLARKMLALFGKVIKKGDIVELGHYPTDFNENRQPVKWKVFGLELGKSEYNSNVLLITEKAIDSMPYNNEKQDVTWEECSLRKYMNSQMINDLFDTDEQKLIKEVLLENRTFNDFPSGGNDTNDKLFLLNIHQLAHYGEKNIYESDDAKCAKPTEYAIKRGVARSKNNGNCYWALRWPGSSNSKVAYVGAAGGFVKEGYDVNDGHAAIRPAVWINLE